MSESSEKKVFLLKTFGLEAFLFSLALILGIITAFNWQELFKFQNLQPEQISFWRFIFYFLFGTLVVLSITLLGKKFQSPKRAIFKIFFILSSVFGMLYLFFPFLNIFSLIGLFLSFYIFASQKVRQPIPALPPIALFSIIGYIITRF